MIFSDLAAVVTEHSAWLYVGVDLLVVLVWVLYCYRPTLSIMYYTSYVSNML